MQGKAFQPAIFGWELTTHGLATRGLESSCLLQLLLAEASLESDTVYGCDNRIPGLGPEGQIVTRQACKLPHEVIKGFIYIVLKITQAYATGKAFQTHTVTHSVE